jgi:dopamine beta-monooxygenase
MKAYFVISLLLPGLALAKDPSTYFGGSDNGGYTSWLQGVSNRYKKTAFVDATQDGAGVALHWTISGDTINLAVAARATGWVGFGLGEAGAMPGADIVLYSAASNELVDSYVLDQPGMPFRDERQSWTLVNSTKQNGFTIFEASRRLDTGDTQDRVLVDDSDIIVAPTRVLAAWGDTATPSYHAKNNARGVVRFFGTSSITEEEQAFSFAMAREAEGNFTVRATKYIIRAAPTTYAVFCVSRDDLLAQGVNLNQDLHTIGIEPIINPSTQRFVHHFVVFASSLPWNSSLPCDTYPPVEIASTWAPGDVPYRPPANVGSPLGLKGFQSFQIQIHYNNPLREANFTDDSGIRMYYTSKKRAFDLGVFEIGDPAVTLRPRRISPNGGLSQHVFDCNRCSSTLSAPVTVIREILHMHVAGVSMSNAQIRNGEIIHKGQIEYYDFAQSGGYLVQQPSFTMQPGDRFRTICNYNSNQRNVTWGLASSDEMCITYLYYYPRQVIKSSNGNVSFTCGLKYDTLPVFSPDCGVTYTQTPNFTEASQLGRVFGTKLAVAPTAPVAGPVAPAAPMASPVAPIAAPVAPPMAPMMAPMAPKATPVVPPTVKPNAPKRCGFLRLSIACLVTRCGILGRRFGWCKN